MTEIIDKPLFKIDTINQGVLSFYKVNNYFDKSIMIRMSYHNRITFQRIDSVINYRTIFSMYSLLSALYEFSIQRNYISIEDTIKMNDNESLTFTRLNGYPDYSITYHNKDTIILMQFDEDSLYDFIYGFNINIISSEEWYE